MNLVEHYIQEILSEKIKINPYTDKPYCVVKMIVNCYGNTSEVNTIFDAEEWERVKKQGYYLG